jgi:micrococcal nuclease
LSSGQVEPFAYRVTVLRVVDGDTLDVDIDLGFSMSLMGQRLRLLRVNTPERKGKTKTAGDAAWRYAKEWLRSHTDIMIRSRKREPGHGEKDSFGRYLVEVFGDNESGKQECLNDDLLDSGNAVPFREDD